MIENYFKMEKGVPVFLGFLGSLICCALISINLPGVLFVSADRETAGFSGDAWDTAQFFSGIPDEKNDRILKMYRIPETKEHVVGFFAAMCGSQEIADVILFYADSNKIPAALAFALSWEESRFNSKAINAHNRDGSIDRGLFQLNNRSFPNLDINDFFIPAVNAKYGMSHLQHCLEAGGSEIAALAMYNAGTGRVRSAGTPKSTLDYIHRILKNRDRIDAQFNEYLVNRGWEKLADDNLLASAGKQGKIRFVPLMPLGNK